MDKYVLIVAGGRGERMGGDLPKQFIPIAGKPLLMHTLTVFHKWDVSAKLVLVLPESHQSYWNMLCKELDFQVPHDIANGGETRFHSVINGLAKVSGSGLIAVHDGVRPFVGPEVITACFEKAALAGAAIPVVDMVDSLRKRGGGHSKPVDRSSYVAVQTPQVFASEILLKAYSVPYSEFFTDDASVVEASGVEVSLVEGNRENIKITTAIDLLLAKAVLEK
jgi:2-C-methyl-D-erythritol 4-phosphate cytidylyltransferase